MQSLLLVQGHPDGAGTVVQDGAGQVRQQLPIPGLVPLGQVPERRVWQAPQSRLLVQVIVGLSTHVPILVLGSMLQVGVHVSKPVFPHVDLAAQRVTLPLQLFGMPHAASALVTWATQLTYWP